MCAHSNSAVGAQQLSVVVFTAGPLSPTNRVFLARLASDPLVALQSIIVDEHRRPNANAVKRCWRGLRRHGLPWIFFKCQSKCKSWLVRASLHVYNSVHGLEPADEGYTSFAALHRVAIHKTRDIHSQSTIGYIRSLRPQLGVILGGRILKAEVIDIPTFGTLNIHKRKVPEFRGGGRVGYWEMLNYEQSIGVTIHFATVEVDAGPVLAETTIAFEANETLDSISIKSDIVGTNLYTEVIHNFARGNRHSTPQDDARAHTYRSEGEYAEHQFNARLRTAASTSMRTLRRGRPWLTTARVFLQYLLVLPVLIAKRKRLVRCQRAPILMLYYHVVANRPVNPLCISLEEFVRQIEFIKRYCEIISADEAVRRLRSGKNGKLAVVLTFDDGYADNTWAIQYLKFHDIPACFFVSAGHVREQRPFQHDLDLGVRDARPMSEAMVQELAVHPFSIGSHGLYHEDFGKVDPETGRQALKQSKQQLAEITGTGPSHFSFPKGLRDINITRETFRAALAEYSYVYSAYGGYNFPAAGQRHFVRCCNPYHFLDLVLLLDGYRSLTSVLTGDGWATRTWDMPPYTTA